MHEYSCEFCAYYKEPRNCAIHDWTIPKPYRLKCRDWCDQDAGIKETK